MISFQANGCMATDHKLEWIGEVLRFEDPKHRGWNLLLRTDELVICKVIKRADNHRDCRDVDLGQEIVVTGDTSLQKLGQNLWIRNH